MDKLQLYITVSNGQYRHLQDMDINPEDETRACLCDLTDALADVRYDPAGKHIFYLLKSTDKGVFVTVLRTIPDRAANHLAAWVFVPYDIDIPDADLYRALDEVVAVVSRPSINNDGLSRLRNVFERSYPQFATPGAVVANQGAYYAHRFYGGNTGDELSDLIGNKRYQTAYLRYAGVLLIDKAIVSDVTGTDLTDEPLEQMVRIFPPSDATPNYQPIIFGKPFVRPFMAPLMGTVEVIWESPSAPDVSQSVMINRPDMHIEPIAAASRPKQVETPPEIDDNTIVIDKSTPAAPQRSAVKTDPRVINTDRQHVYNFEIPAKSASISGMIRFTLTSHTPLHDSPIDGYELSEDIQEGTAKSNHLVYVSSDNLQTHAIWAVCGFVVGILLTLVCTCATSHSDSKGDDDGAAVTDTTAVVSDTTKINKPEPPADTSLTGAIHYLDTNQKWTKAELEAYPDLHGLYHDLNTINRERIINHWGKKLENSRQFAKIVEHTKLGKKKKPYFNNPKPGQMTFNTGSDETIMVRSYLNCIDH